MKYKVGDRVAWCGSIWVIHAIMQINGFNGLMLHNLDPYFGFGEQLVDEHDVTLIK